VHPRASLDMDMKQEQNASCPGRNT
jgi:hypothetical protein